MRRPEVGLVFGDTIHVTSPFANAPRTGLTSFRVAPPVRGACAQSFVWCNFVPTCTVLVRRSSLEETGGFDEACALSADYLAWFRIALRHELDYVDCPVAEYTVHADGISFPLGQALSTRIALFTAELEQTTDSATRDLLRQLLFNLSLHLALAALRGRAHNVPDPLALSCRTASRAAGLKAALWAAEFAANQLRLRARRLLT